MSPDFEQDVEEVPKGEFNLRVEGTKIVCHGHDHDCGILAAGFKVMLIEVRKRDQKIRELQEEILRQEVGGLFKEGN